jgi:hypothetical protein
MTRVARAPIKGQAPWLLASQTGWHLTSPPGHRMKHMAQLRRAWARAAGRSTEAYALHSCGARHLHLPSAVISASNGIAGSLLELPTSGQLSGGHGCSEKSRLPQQIGWSTTAQLEAHGKMWQTSDEEKGANKELPHSVRCTAFPRSLTPTPHVPGIADASYD